MARLFPAQCSQAPPWPSRIGATRRRGARCSTPATFPGAPPAHVVTAGIDPLRDEGRALAGHLARDGVRATHVEYPGLVHEFFLMPDVSTAVLPASEEVAAVLASALA